MESLLLKVIDAHGGLKRWNELKTVHASMVSNGKLFDIQGLPSDPNPKEVIAYLHEQRISVSPFGDPNYKTNFTPNRIAIEDKSGKVIKERTGTPKSIQDHMKGKQWDDLDRANFNGYARWNYLTTPFFMSMPGIKIEEIAPWQENNENWRGLQVTFPAMIACHSTIQQYYFGDDYLLRRLDYEVNVARDLNFKAAHYVYDFVNASGILVPTKRRVYKKDTDGKPIKNEVMVGMDVTNVYFTKFEII